MTLNSSPFSDSSDNRYSNNNNNDDDDMSSGNSNRKRQNQVDKESDEYRKLRERNNQAVKKSRTKSRMKAKQTQERVAKLRQERQDLLKIVDNLKSQLTVYKQIFIRQVGASAEEELSKMDLSFLNDDDTSENHCY